MHGELLFIARIQSSLSVVDKYFDKSNLFNLYMELEPLTG